MTNFDFLKKFLNFFNRKIVSFLIFLITQHFQKDQKVFSKKSNNFESRKLLKKFGKSKNFKSRKFLKKRKILKNRKLVKNPIQKERNLNTFLGVSYKSMLNFRQIRKQG